MLISSYLVELMQKYPTHLNHLVASSLPVKYNVINHSITSINDFQVISYQNSLCQSMIYLWFNHSFSNNIPNVLLHFHDIEFCWLKKRFIFCFWGLASKSAYTPTWNVYFLEHWNLWYTMYLSITTKIMKIGIPWIIINTVLP